MNLLTIAVIDRTKYTCTPYTKASF